VLLPALPLPPPSPSASPTTPLGPPGLPLPLPLTAAPRWGNISDAPPSLLGLSEREGVVLVSGVLPVGISVASVLAAGPHPSVPPLLIRGALASATAVAVPTSFMGGWALRKRGVQSALDQSWRNWYCLSLRSRATTSVACAAPKGAPTGTSETESCQERSAEAQASRSEDHSSCTLPKDWAGTHQNPQGRRGRKFWA